MASMETILLMQRLREELKLMERLNLSLAADLPWPGPPYLNALATIRMLKKIFENEERAMIFSEALVSAQRQAGITLRDDETVACMLCVVKKPDYLSEAFGPTPEPSTHDPTPEPAAHMQMAESSSSEYHFPVGEIKASAWRAIRYYKIMEPAIMKELMKRREEDKIAY